MLARVSKRIGSDAGAPQFLVADSCFPQTLDVLRARTEPLGIELVLMSNDALNTAPLGGRVYGALVQTPDEAGRVHDLRVFIARAKQAGVLVAVGTDLLSLALLTPLETVNFLFHFLQSVLQFAKKPHGVAFVRYLRQPCIFQRLHELDGRYLRHQPLVFQ